MVNRLKNTRLSVSFGLGAVCVILLLFGGEIPLSADQRETPDWKTKVLTGKETLAGKASDEQRVNNCKVPMDKRGDRQRPDICGAKQALE